MTNNDVIAARARLLLTTAEATRALGISHSELYRQLNTGRLSAVKIGRRTMIPAKAIDDWIAALPPAQFPIAA